MTLKENNQQAIEKVERTYGKLRDVEPFGNPNNVMSYLRASGFVCTKCGKNNITWPVVKFYQFEPDVVCRNCQNKY